MFGLNLITPPASEPTSLSVLKQQLRINVSDEDSLLSNYLIGARQTFENLAQIQIVPATWQMTLDFWPGWDLLLPYNFSVNTLGGTGYDSSAMFIYQMLFMSQYGLLYLPRPPLISVTNIQYYDQSNVLQTWPSTNYNVDTSRQPGRVYITGTFPTITTTIRPAVLVTFQSGYSSVPFLIQQAIYLLAGSWYEQRTSLTTANLKELPMGFMSIVDQYRSFVLSDLGMR